MTRLKTLLPLLALVLTLGLTSAPAWALDLQSAKSQGLVGERRDGLVGAVPPSPSAEVILLVKKVNDQRLALYRDLSEKNGAPLSETQKLFASKQFEKAKPGEYLQGAGGWVQR